VKIPEFALRCELFEGEMLSPALGNDSIRDGVRLHGSRLGRMPQLGEGVVEVYVITMSFCRGHASNCQCGFALANGLTLRMPAEVINAFRAVAGL
jgi:hypothetical protein